MTDSVEVFKFGGSSVGTGKNIRQALKLIDAHSGPLIVVVSAMGGITDRLLSSAHAAAKGELDLCEMACAHMTQRYLNAVEELVKSEAEVRKLSQLISESTGEFRTICQSLSVLREHTPRIMDAIVARGERFAAKLFCSALNDLGVSSTYVDGTELIHLNRQFDQLTPVTDECENAAKNILPELLKQHRVIMVPGFIGKGPEGEVRTLGRSGSDYTATIIASSINARQVTLFKDVDGMLTADPGFVPEARVVPFLHYREATELAYYGAKVLHPRTIIPLIEKTIPLIIKNSFSPEYPGTKISQEIIKDTYPVKALTAITSQTLISVEGKGMIGVPGIAGRTFSALAGAGISVSFITQSSSEASICFVVPKAESEKAMSVLRDCFHWELKHQLIDRLKLTDDLAIVAVVGLGMEGTPGIAARTFSALAKKDVNIIAVAQGSSELNISFAIQSKDVKSALSSLHQEYQLDKLKALPHRNGRSSEVCIYGFGQIGQTLTQQINRQKLWFQNTLQLNCEIVSLCDRSSLWTQPGGLTETQLKKAISCKKSKQPLTSVSFDTDPPNFHGPTSDGLARVFDMPVHRGIFTDLTATESYPVIMNALKNGFHIVLANKKPMAVSQDQFDEMTELSKSKNLKIRYEATVGAGLPILDTLRKLDSAGDQIYSIQGCLSGTLGYILTAVEDGALFSEAVYLAWKNGFTEPDPAEDLSGMDVARKALILARTLGYKINPQDMNVEPLYKPELYDSDPEIFIKNLKQQDEDLKDKLLRAVKEKQTLRYTAGIENGQVRVGIEALAENSPLGRLRGTNNQITISSRRYEENPLIVTGPGAGAEVTAAGVLNDIVALSTLDD